MSLRATRHKDKQGDGDIGSTHELDSTTRDPPSDLVGNGLGLRTTLLQSTRTAADSSKAKRR
jgi:hypothetical protein